MSAILTAAYSDVDFAGFFVGQEVVNFGVVAVVERLDHARGVVLRDERGEKWIADPAKCRAVNPAAGWPAEALWFSGV